MAWRLLKAGERNRSNLHDHETPPLDREARSRHGPAALTHKDMMPNEFHLIRGRTLPADISRPVIAIGNFDGLHRGHHAVIDAARELAKELHRPAAVLTFEPHPRSFFKPDAPLFRLTPEGIKAKLLARFGLQAMIVLPFDAAMASTTAEHFINDILFRELNVAGVVVGHDFHFGRGRGGTPHSIAEACRQDGRTALIIEALLEKGAAVSSSAVRAALAEGDMPRANHLLGYRYLFEAEVRHGEKIGRTLGYPTANLRLPENSVLKHGIYAVRVAVGEKVYNGVASYGRRPTFDNGAPLFEVFLFDFTGDLYGKTLQVECVAWQRGEIKFDGIEPLIAQMDKDATDARAILAKPIDPEAPSLLPL